MEAYNLRRSSGSKEIEIDLSSLGTYIVYGESGDTGDYATTYMSGNKRILDITVWNTYRTHITNYIALGSFFNNVQSCEISVDINGYVYTGFLSGNSGSGVSVGPSAIVYKYYSTGQENFSWNGTITKPSNNIIISGYIDKSTTTSQRFVSHIEINSIKISKIKFI